MAPYHRADLGAHSSDLDILPHSRDAVARLTRDMVWVRMGLSLPAEPYAALPTVFMII